MKHRGLRAGALALLAAALFSGCGGLLGGADSASTSAPGLPGASSAAASAATPAASAPQAFAASVPDAAASAPSPATQANAPAAAAGLPEGFSYVRDHLPLLLEEMRYYTAYNFTGRRVEGYEAPVAILRSEAAAALAGAAEEMAAAGYVFKIFDAYRPQRAVADFERWAADPADTAMKAYFYPEVDKASLFNLGYLASRSGHSRGSTVDLTLVSLATGQELDMGTPFDFFGEASHFGTAAITEEQAANREILRDVMERHGFVHYQNEWWHYVLAAENEPDAYFDFPVG